MFETCIKQLIHNLQKPLPGYNAQRTMAPPQRLPAEEYDLHTLKAKNACALVLLYPNNNKVCIPLLLRSVYNGIHSAQISLPGGKPEISDTSLVATALRETQEEIGVDPQRITVIGSLTPLYIPPSNFLLHPFVGYMNEHPLFEIDPKEVQRVYEITLDEFKDAQNRKKKLIYHQSIKSELITPYYAIQEQTIWGATAMVLSELLTLI